MKKEVHNIDQLREVFNTISKADLSKGFVIEWKRKKEIRSTDQNALYWLWLTCLERETGNDKNDLHDHFREVFLPYQLVDVLGSQKMRLTSTSGLSKEQFSDYLNKIQVFSSSELAVILPNPEDLRFNDFLMQYEDRY